MDRILLAAPPALDAATPQELRHFHETASLLALVLGRCCCCCGGVSNSAATATRHLSSRCHSVIVSRVTDPSFS
jgi:hypothetical protein